MNQFEKIEDEMHDFNTGPKQAKGGVFAPTDIELIKNALNYYLRLYLSDVEVKQIANLLHRLNNRT